MEGEGRAHQSLRWKLELDVASDVVGLDHGRHLHELVGCDVRLTVRGLLYHPCTLSVCQMSSLYLSRGYDLLKLIEFGNDICRVQTEALVSSIEYSILQIWRAHRVHHRRRRHHHALRHH